MKKSFGAKLRELRLSRDCTMGALARKLDVSVPFISDVEHGRRPPLTRDRIVQAAEFLNVDPTELLLAAAQHKGSVELETDSDRRREAAAALARGWAAFDDTDLDQLREFAEQIRKKRGLIP